MDKPPTPHNNEGQTRKYETEREEDERRREGGRRKRMERGGAEAGHIPDLTRVPRDSSAFCIIHSYTFLEFALRCTSNVVETRMKAQTMQFCARLCLIKTIATLFRSLVCPQTIKIWPPHRNMNQNKVSSIFQNDGVDCKHLALEQIYT